MRDSRANPSPASPAQPWTRRQWIGATLAGLAAAGCSQRDFNRAVGTNGTINILIWADYFSDEIIATFEKETGISVNPTLFSSNDQLYGILSKPEASFDLAMPSAFMARHLRDQGLLTTYNLKRVPGVKGIDRRHFKISYDPENHYVIPYIWGSTGIGYNSWAIDGLPKGWLDLFRSKSHREEKNKVSVLDDARFTLGTLLIYLGLSPNASRRDDVEKAGDLLLRLRPQIDYFENDRVREYLVHDVVQLAMAWTGDVARGMDQNRSLRISLPSEGSIVFRDSFVIPKSARNQEGAERFVEYLLRPVVAAAVTNFSFYATTIVEARPFVNRSIINGAAYFLHPAGKNFFLEDNDISDDVYQDVWRRVKEAPRG